MAPEGVITYFRIRVVATFNSGNKEITSDLPHLHQSHYEVVAFQPGNPGSSALGSFSIKLHPPGTEGYAAAKPIYDQLDYIQRVELYGSPDGASLGKLYYAGIITGIRKGYGQNPIFELTGTSDLAVANLSKPFPGELIWVGGTTAQRPYLGTNELGWADTFSPFTIGNYTSTNLPALTSGTWTGATDDALSVASCTTGTGAVLISKTGAVANDVAHQHFVEISGRLNPSNDVTNAGRMGVGLTLSNADCTTSLLAFVTAKVNASNGWDLSVTLRQYIASALTDNTVTTALTNVQDSDGLIPVTIGLLAHAGVPSVTVNGKVVMSLTISLPTGVTFDPGTGTVFPFLFFATPASGTAVANETNLVQMIRYAQDLNPNTTTFKASFVSGSHGLANSIDPGPTFLESWSRQATRQNIYWRYTPVPYVVGVRTLGTVTFATDPGTDRGTDHSVMFSRADGSLIDLILNANADQFVASSMAAGPPGSDGAGLAYWRDIATMTNYGVVEDQILAVINPNFGELRRAALNIQSNRLNLSTSGSKTAVVLRDPQTADVWRELDKVMIHDPEMGINYLVARVIGYTFDEGQPTQTLMLDQFSVDDPTIPARRLQQGVFQTAVKFGNR